MKAWLITWEGTEEIPPDEKVVSILSARMSIKEVRKYVERLYADLTYSFQERLDMARYNRPTRNPHPATIERSENRSLGIITCGHNPFLRAKRVERLRMEKDKLVWDR